MLGRARGWSTDGEAVNKDGRSQFHQGTSCGSTSKQATPEHGLADHTQSLKLIVLETLNIEKKEKSKEAAQDPSPLSARSLSSFPFYV